MTQYKGIYHYFYKNLSSRIIFKFMKRVLMLIVAGLLVWIILSYAGARYASHPKLVDLPEASHFFDFPVEEITLQTTDNVRIEAWYIKGNSAKAVVLTNGIKGNRRGLVERAKLYAEAGFGVLLIDLRGTGESEAQPISYGWYERHDIHVATDFLRKKDYTHIGAHGISLGAAATVYGLQEQPDYAFVVLESCYGSVRDALNNRLEMKHIPRFSTMFMQKFSEWHLGVTMQELRPTNYIKSAQMPVLILAGDSEQRVKRTETESLYANCASSNKTLHYIKGAKHVDLLNHSPEVYRKIISGFLIE